MDGVSSGVVEQSTDCHNLLQDFEEFPVPKAKVVFMECPVNMKSIYNIQRNKVKGTRALQTYCWKNADQESRTFPPWDYQIKNSNV